VQVLSSVWNMMLGALGFQSTPLGSTHTRTRADSPSDWGVFEPAIKGKRHDGQAACEPGAGGCGGVPVHPARLHTHRTSPAQALLTTLTETC
jgi:hypothetical protein